MSKEQYPHLCELLDFPGGFELKEDHASFSSEDIEKIEKALQHGATADLAIKELEDQVSEKSLKIKELEKEFEDYEPVSPFKIDEFDASEDDESVLVRVDQIPELKNYLKPNFITDFPQLVYKVEGVSVNEDKSLTISKKAFFQLTGAQF
jgi:hypothetical protein